MSLIIHGSALSPFTRKAVLAASALGVQYEPKDLNPYLPSSAFSDMSPLKRIPVLQDGDFTLNDSSAICAYLDRAFSDTKTHIIPRDAKALGYTLWIEEYADTALFKEISEGVFRPIFINQLNGLPPDLEKVRDAVANRLPKPLEYLEGQITNKRYFVEDRLTLADLAVYAQMVNLEHSQHLPRAETFPALMAHYALIKSRPTSTALFGSEVQYLRAMVAQLNQRSS